MVVDDAYLVGLGSYRDPEGNYMERFLTPVIGGAHTVAVLTEPLGPRRETGWVICHSLGMEQMHLAHLEARAARALASDGFPVLRFQGQGYGDSQGPGDGGTLASHLADATDAISVLRAEAGPLRIGAIGPKFGGAIAALTASRHGLPFMVLWEPVVRGDRLIRDQLLASAVSGLLDRSAKGDRSARPAASDDIGAIDLVRNLESFDGAALLIGLSTDGTLGPGLATLGDRLRSLGAEVTVASLADPFAREFGQFHLRAVAGRKGKEDVRAGLDGALVRATVQWCRARAVASAG